MIVFDRDRGQYVAQSYEGGAPQTISFTTWAKGKMVLQAGTSCEELIRVLIDHIKHLNHRQAHPKHERVIQTLRMSLMGLEMLAAEKSGRRLVTVDFNKIEDITVCPICGHIACEHKEEIAKEKEA